MSRRDKLYFDFEAGLAHLRDEEAALSPSALGALSGASKHEVAAFAQTWANLPPERRRRAAQMLVDLAEENIEKDYNLLFRHMLVDEDPQVRARAIDGLWEDEDVALVKPLVEFLRSDPDAEVRAVAADALGRFVLLVEYERLPQNGVAELIHDSLLATIRSPIEPIKVRARALEAIAYWSQEVVRDVITAAYADDNAEMRASAVSAMGRTADKYWRKTAAAELTSGDARMRYEAARAVGELEDRTSVPRLIELLEDPDREVQEAAITALGQIGGKQAKEALASAAESDDEVLRSLADDALQELEFSSNSDLLMLDLDSEDGDVPDDEDMDLDTGSDDADASEEDWPDFGESDDPSDVDNAAGMTESENDEMFE